MSRHSRRQHNARALCLHRDNGICGLCGHPGATTLGHLIPVTARPDLEWEPTNHQAQHGPKAGNPGGCHVQDCDCPGNFGLRDRPYARPPSREW